MELRPLGSTGLSVSPIGLGTVKIGRNSGVKYPGGDGFALPDDDAVRSLVGCAADLGVNLIDTAPAYGTSEQRLGDCLRQNRWFGGRDRWIVCTKVGESFNTDGSSSFDFSGEGTRASVHRSLRRLGTDRLDVVLVHSDGSDRAIIDNGETLESLAALAEQGTVRTFGISTKTPDGALHAIQRLSAWPGRAVVMLTLNPRDRADEPAIDAAHAAGVGVLVKKALLSGHAAAHVGGTDPVGACVRFAAGRPGVGSVVIGTSRPEHLRHAIEALRTNDDED